MSSPNPRPLSPHLTIWKWGPGMTVSILHRLTGGALTVAGLAILSWWLAAIASGDEAYAKFASFINFEWSGIPWVIVALSLLTWAFFQHLFSGLRHLVLDTGAGYELKVNKFWAIMTIPASALAAAASLYLIMGVGQ
jgi:succinate dehydrogenase / fumarate reductase, cytochrome b subunit